MWRAAGVGRLQPAGDEHEHHQNWRAGSRWHQMYTLFRVQKVVRYTALDTSVQEEWWADEKNVPFPPPNCIPPPGNPPPKNILNSSSGLTSFSNLIPLPDREGAIPEVRDSGSPPCESNAARKFASERTWNAFETTTRPQVSE